MQVARLCRLRKHRSSCLAQFACPGGHGRISARLVIVGPFAGRQEAQNIRSGPSHAASTNNAISAALTPQFVREFRPVGYPGPPNVGVQDAAEDVVVAVAV